MSAPDIAGVLGRHPQENARPKSHDGDPWKYDGTYVCACGEEFKAASGIGGAFRGHRAHVAAVLREQIAAWLGSDVVERGIVQQANAEDDRHFAAGSSHGLGAGEAVSLTLAALATQVAPSRVPGEGS